MKKAQWDYEGFLEAITSDYRDCTLSPQEIVEYMRDKDEVPEGVTLWEPVENDSPANLVKNGLGTIRHRSEVLNLISATKALGKAIQIGDPQTIADRWGNVATALKEIEG